MPKPIEPETPVTIKRGAPQGNTNALKTGLYSPRFFRVKIDDLIQASPDGLEDEIDLLRRINMHAIELAEQGKPITEFRPYFQFLAITCQRIAVLLKTRKDLTDDGDTTIDQLNKALNEAIRELQKEHANGPLE
jgi:hypothetical protein